MSSYPGSAKGREPLVCIATAPNEMIANLWKDVLKDNGIHSLLKSTSFMDSAQYAHNVFPYQIYVLASEAEKAKEVLLPFLEEE
jgi:hypothetical protein